MSTILIHDIRSSKELDGEAMSAVRGGFAFGPDVKVNLNLNQRIAQVQEIQVNTLNDNGVIGAGFVGPNINLDVLQKATNSAVLPKFF
ncbi:MAG: hypothetical protein V4508_13130 [Pseudomonadota bacterium]